MSPRIRVSCTLCPPADRGSGDARLTGERRYPVSSGLWASAFPWQRLGVGSRAGCPRARPPYAPSTLTGDSAVATHRAVLCPASETHVFAAFYYWKGATISLLGVGQRKGERSLSQGSECQRTPCWTESFSRPLGTPWSEAADMHTLGPGCEGGYPPPGGIPGIWKRCASWRL